MIRSELIQKLADTKEIDRHAAERIVIDIFAGMAEELIAGGGIEIRGFGSFSIRNYCGHEGRNPKSGEIVIVKPKRSVFFKTGKEMKERVMKPNHK